MITISLCRKHYIAYMGREDITVSQFWYMTDSRYDARSHWMSKAIFVHKVVAASRNLRKQGGLA